MPGPIYNQREREGSVAKRPLKLVFMLLVCAVSAGAAQPCRSPYLGFDRNDYPGDAALATLRQTFCYSSYWLNPPPGETHNPWAGKRALLKARGFGFLVLFNGRLDAELTGADAAALGRADGRAAVTAAQREGFSKGVRIFLDQEEGGRLLPEQAAYVLAWIEAVQAGGDRAGVYCSGIPVPEGSSTITTAQSLVENLRARPKNQSRQRVALWIADDRCPPSPGCSTKAPAVPRSLPPNAPAFEAVWQYAQSPRRPQFSAGCPQNQAPDGKCYAPGLPQDANSFVDLNTALSPDPSEAP